MAEISKRKPVKTTSGRTKKPNVVIIQGSYHKSGMVASLVESFSKGIMAENPSARIKIVDLMETEVDFCKGCWACAKSPGKIGKCVIKDGVEKILPEMLESDVLVFATPIYELGPTARMKRFMERNLPGLAQGTGFPKVRNEKRKGKIGVVILSSGAPYPMNIIFGFTSYPSKILKLMCEMWSCSKFYNIRAGGIESSVKTKENWLGKSHQLGLKVGREMKYH